jgi:hypothetical protein
LPLLQDLGSEKFVAKKNNDGLTSTAETMSMMTPGEAMILT